MKKIIIWAFIFLFVQNAVFAKDYAKMHIKEMKKSQKYSTSKNFFKDYTKNESQYKLGKIKDPKLFKLKNYEEVSAIDYEAKLRKDEIEYQKISKYLASRKQGEYKTAIYTEDFYKIYRIAEKIIRANNLDFINWRIQILPTAVFNAYSSQTNCITIYTGALDTFIDNDDALALLIGHELAHSLLGHSARSEELYQKLLRAYKRSYVQQNNLNYFSAKHKILHEYRKMEYTADVEGAKLALKAGYNLDDAKDVLSFINTFGNYLDWDKTHPSPENRLKNFEENKKYFLEDWEKQGRYNIYSSNVLQCQKSSNRKSLTILKNPKRAENEYYQPENLDELYYRFGYKSYLNADFYNAIKYFKKYLKYDSNNFAVYLYLSYSYEYLFKLTNKNNYLKNAKKYANFAKNLEPNNKHVTEQVSSL